MPSELGEGEAGEQPEDRSDELEDLRERIEELYKTPDHGEEEHSESAEETIAGDGSTEHDQQYQEETADVSEPPKGMSEETKELGRDGTEREIESPESESGRERDEELEQLRERVIEQYERTTEDDGGEPKSESVHEEVSALPESTAETLQNEAPGYVRGQEREDPEVVERQLNPEQNTPDSEHGLVREPLLDDANVKVEEREALERLDQSAIEPDEPSASDSIQSEKEVVELEADVEPSSRPTEDSTFARADSTESDRTSDTEAPTEIPTRAKDESKERAIGDREVGQSQPHSSGASTDLGGDLARPRSREETFDPTSGQPHSENVVSRGVSAVYEGGWEVREALGKPVDRGSVPTADLPEVNAPLKISDSGAHLPEAAKLSVGGIDSRVASSDSNQQGDFGIDRSKAKSPAGQGYLSANELGESAKVEGKSTKEHHSEGSEVSDQPGKRDGSSKLGAKPAESARRREFTLGGYISNPDQSEGVKASESRRPTEIESKNPQRIGVVNPDNANGIVQDKVDTKPSTAEKGSKAGHLVTELHDLVKQPIEFPAKLAGDWDKHATYFSVPKSTFHELTGTKLEVEKTYEVHFRIKGVGEAWTRHAESENQAEKPNIRLHVNKTFSDRLQVGSSYQVSIDCVTDKRCLRVANTHQGPGVKIYRDYLESMGFNNPTCRQNRNPVVELGARNLSRHDSRTEKCFTTFRFDSHKPGQDVSRLLVKRLGAKHGDVMEVQYAKPHTMRDFVEIFNSHKPKNMENVALALEQDRLRMRVDEKEILLLNPRLSTNKLQVCLRAEIESSRTPVLFWSDGETTRMKFLQRLPVNRAEASGSGFDIHYHTGRRQESVFRFRTNKFDESTLDGGLKLISAPEYPGDSYIYGISPNFQELTRSRLRSANGPFDGRCEKGDISEEIQRYLLSTLGQWEEVEYHPYDKAWRTHESKKRGPDSLQRSKSSGELGYFEFRWSTDVYQAYFNCRRQALDDLKKWPTYKGEPVKDAYVGTLEWDVRKSSLNFYVRKADPNNKGHNLLVDF